MVDGGHFSLRQEAGTKRQTSLSQRRPRLPRRPYPNYLGSPIPIGNLPPKKQRREGIPLPQPAARWSDAKNSERGRPNADPARNDRRHFHSLHQHALHG